MDIPDGYLTNRQALDCGWSARGLRRATRTGDIVRIRHGAFADRQRWDELDAEGRYLLRVHATLDRALNYAVISHESAAAVHGIALLNPNRRAVHLTANGTAGGFTGPGRILHRHRLDADDVEVREGRWVTTPARTAVDIACTADTFAQAVCAVESAFRVGATPDSIAGATDRAGRRRGIGAARRAAAFADSRTESVGESWSRVLMHAWREIPAPRLQHEFRSPDGEFIARTDFDWNGRLVGEFDGMVKYRSHASEAVVAEKRREDRLRGLGVHVVRWTWDDLLIPQRLRTILRNGMQIASRE